MFEDYFWRVAKQTPYYEWLLNQRSSYTQDQRDKDNIAASNLLKLAVNIANSNMNYRAIVLKKNNTLINNMLDIIGDSIPQST